MTVCFYRILLLKSYTKKYSQNTQNIESHTSRIYPQAYFMPSTEELKNLQLSEKQELLN